MWELEMPYEYMIIDFSEGHCIVLLLQKCDLLWFALKLAACTEGLLF